MIQDNRFKFDSAFLQSGDLRIFMAMNQTRGYKMQEFADFDDLVQLQGTGDTTTLSYNTEAVLNRGDFYKDLIVAPPILTDPNGSNIRLNCLHRNSTCILVGSGGSLDIKMVRRLQNKGVPIITMGNATYSYPHSDYWIGNGPTEAYAPTAFYSPKTISVLWDRYKDGDLWDFANKTSMNRPVKQMPGMLYVPERQDYIDMEHWVDKPFVTDFGLDSTFGLGLSLAICLGFSNIVLAGVDLGGELGNFFAFNELPHKEVYEEKKAKYEKTIETFHEINGELLKRAIRVTAVEGSPLHIPVFERKYLIDSIDSIINLAMPTLKTPEGLTMPLSKRKRHHAEENEHKKARLDALELYEYIPKLMEVGPEFFDTPGVQNAYDTVTQKLNEGGCGNCAKRRFLRPVFNIFVQHAQDRRSAIHEVWREVIPDKYTLMVNKVLVYRRDMEHKKHELDKYRPRGGN